MHFSPLPNVIRVSQYACMTPAPSSLMYRTPDNPYSVDLTLSLLSLSSLTDPAIKECASSLEKNHRMPYFTVIEHKKVRTIW